MSEESHSDAPTTITSAIVAALTAMHNADASTPAVERYVIARWPHLADELKRSKSWRVKLCETRDKVARDLDLPRRGVHRAGRELGRGRSGKRVDVRAKDLVALAALKSHLIPGVTLEEIVSLFEVLGDATRLRAILSAARTQQFLQELESSSAQARSTMRGT